jgi:hypothetical protein
MACSTSASVSLLQVLGRLIECFSFADKGICSHRESCLMTGNPFLSPYISDIDTGHIFILQQIFYGYIPQTGNVLLHHLGDVIHHLQYGQMLRFG